MNNYDNDYTEGIKNWKTLIDQKDTKEITRLLTSGTFKITRNDYQKLNQNAPNVHYYFGVLNNKLQVYILDSKSDENQSYHNLISIEMDYGIDTSSLQDVNINHESEVTHTEFVDRVFNWTLLGYNWIDHALKTGRMFEGIQNPMKDYMNEFNGSSVNNVYHSFGLHLEKGSNTIIDGDFSNYKIDLFCSYVCKKDTGKEQYWEVSWPTFSDSNLNHNKSEVFSLYKNEYAW